MKDNIILVCNEVNAFHLLKKCFVKSTNEKHFIKYRTRITAKWLQTLNSPDEGAPECGSRPPVERRPVQTLPHLGWKRQGFRKSVPPANPLNLPLTAVYFNGFGPLLRPRLSFRYPRFISDLKKQTTAHLPIIKFCRRSIRARFPSISVGFLSRLRSDVGVTP